MSTDQRFDESEFSYYRSHKKQNKYTMNYKNLFLNDGEQPIARYRGS